VGYSSEQSGDAGILDMNDIKNEARQLALNAKNS